MTERGLYEFLRATSDALWDVLDACLAVADRRAGHYGADARLSRIERRLESALSHLDFASGMLEAWEKDAQGRRKRRKR